MWIGPFLLRADVLVTCGHRQPPPVQEVHFDVSISVLQPNMFCCFVRAAFRFLLNFSWDSIPAWKNN